MSHAPGDGVPGDSLDKSDPSDPTLPTHKNASRIHISESERDPTNHTLPGTVLLHRSPSTSSLHHLDTGCRIS